MAGVTKPKKPENRAIPNLKPTALSTQKTYLTLAPILAAPPGRGSDSVLDRANRPRPETEAARPAAEK